MVIGKQERQQEQRVEWLRVCWVKNEDFFFFQFFSSPFFFKQSKNSLSSLDRKVERVPRFDAMNKFEKLSSINNSIYHLLAARAARATYIAC